MANSPRLTSFSNQQEEPHAPRQVEQQGNCITRVPQQIHYGEECAVNLRFQPATLNSFGLKYRMLWRVMILGGLADEGRCEAPGDSDQCETQDVVQGPRLWINVCHG